MTKLRNKLKVAWIILRMTFGRCTHQDLTDLFNRGRALIGNDSLPPLRDNDW